jgi:hypothetical protein
MSVPPVMIIDITESQDDAQRRAQFYQARGAQVSGPTRARSVQWNNGARGDPSADASGVLDGDVWVVIAQR